MIVITYRAAIVVVAWNQVIVDGVLSVAPSAGSRQSQVVAAGRWKDYQGPASTVIDLGETAVLPGLVNAHTHWEFSDQKEPIPSIDGTFAGWIANVIQSRARKLEQSTDPTRDRTIAWEAGEVESRNSGSVLVGDIVTPPYPEGSGQSIATTPFLEILGLNQQRGDQLINWATETLARYKDSCCGISPHAPYSTATALYQEAARLAHQFRLPLATHLAETTEEQQLLEDRSGPLVDLFRAMGIWDPDAILTKSFRQVIQSLSPLNHVLLIHGNYLASDDWCNLPSGNWSVVYCPQTHQYFGHPSHPWPRMVQDGVNVALGTDSRASSQSLNLWDDLKLLWRHYPDQPPWLGLKMATENGARALGQEHQFGSLIPGRAGCPLAIPLTKRPSDEQEFWEQLPTLSPSGPLKIPS